MPRFMQSHNDRVELNRLLTSGASAADIATRFDVNKKTVHRHVQWLSQRGLLPEGSSLPLQPIMPKIEREEMLTLHEDGRTAQEIADKFDCTADAVRLALRKEGLKPNRAKRRNRSTNAAKKKVSELYPSGAEIDEICAELDLSRSTIYRYLRELRIPSPRKASSQEAQEREELEKMLREFVSLRDAFRSSASRADVVIASDIDERTRELAAQIREKAALVKVLART